MKKIIIAVLELLVLASALLPWTRDLYSVNTGRAVFESLAIFISLQVVVLGVAWNLSLHDETKRLRTKLDGISDRIGGGIVTRIRDDEFYHEFLQASRSARSRVLISYFAPTPPTDSPAPERAAYYRDHALLVRQKREVKFRRLVRDTPANRRWVAELARDLCDLPNFSLALVTDRPDSEATSLALSVQVADEGEGWLVAIQSHERQAAFRDIRIKDRELVSVLEMYFDRLWQIADVVVDSGRVTEIGNSILAQVSRDQA